MSKTAYTNAKVFTGLSDDYELLTLTVDDETGRLVGVGDAQPADHTVDLQDKFVVPGLVNAHMHMMMDPYGRQATGQSAVRDTAMAFENLQLSLNGGVTYVRDVGSTFDVDLELARWEKAGRALLPGIVGSGPALVMTGGHGADLGVEVDGPDETRKAARENMKRGARNIKLMATGGVSVDGETPWDEQLSEEEMRAAVVEAHHKGFTAAAHAQGTQGIKNAVRAGVDSVEHAIFLDDEAVQMMLDRGTYMVPTLVAPWAINQHPEALPAFMVKKALEVADAHMESTKKAVAAGVKLAMGTDAGTPYNDFTDGVVVELLMMQEAGMTPAQVLQASTLAGADLLHVTNDAGSLEVGKLADFVVLDENPLDSFEAFRHGREVFKKGRLAFSNL
jgi:imidazolonepropionase-like amidohydrolase